jgi:RNA polymerase sigma factor (sigma-70 family)
MNQADSGIEALFLDHREPLIRMLYRMVHCRQTAEDLVHEAYVKFMGASEGIHVACPRPFLYRTAKNLALDHLRKEKVRQRSDCPDADFEDLARAPAPTPSPEHQVLARERVDLLVEAMGGLPERRRQILVLHRFHHWTYDRIAAHLGLSRRTVEKNVQAALAYLLANMAAKDDC